MDSHSDFVSNDPGRKTLRLSHPDPSFPPYLNVDLVRGYTMVPDQVPVGKLIVLEILVRRLWVDNSGPSSLRKPPLVVSVSLRKGRLGVS